MERAPGGSIDSPTEEDEPLMSSGPSVWMLEKHRRREAAVQKVCVELILQ